ncbi:MAG TPA: kelch repeat-containing protein [Candidatus Eisenbacteria bacterium]
MDRPRRLIPVLILAALTPLIAAPAFATNYTWKSAINGSWHTSSNWLPTGVPGPSDVAIINLSGNYTVSVNSNASVGAVGLSGGTGSRRLTVNSATLTTGTGIAVGTAHVLNLNSGTISGAGTLDLQGSLTSSGTSHLNSPVMTHAATAITISGTSLEVAGGFELHGNLETNPLSSGRLIVGSGVLTNSGTLDIENGDVTGNVTNGAGNTISLLNSTMQGSVVNLGTLSIQGTSSLLAFLDNEGLVTIQNGVLLASGDTGHQNYGTIRVQGGTFTVTQTPAGYFSNQGTLEVFPGAGVAITGGAFRNQPTGILSGGGTCDMSGTSFLNDGTIKPGASPGTLTVNGDVILGSTSVVEMEIGGTVPGSSQDRLAISGIVTLAGTLNVSLVSGFMPQPGEAFELITCGGHTGQFTTVNGTDLGGGRYLAFVPQTRVSDPIRLTALSETWTNVAATGPAARLAHTAVYDGFSNRMIVFGGLGPAGELNDTWVLTNANGSGGTPAWQPLSPGNAPPLARQGHAAAYDGVNNRLIVYGGYSAARPEGFLDVWVLSNANGLGGTPMWTQLLPGGSTPDRRAGSGIAYNPSSNRLILFGGLRTLDPCAGASNDVWILTHANGLGGTPEWSLLPATGPLPAARSGAVLGYDSATNRLIVQGGTVACTWTIGEAHYLTHADGLGGTPTWSTLPLVNPAPPGRTYHGGIYDAATDRLLTFGGIDANGTMALDDILLVTGATNAGAAGWSRLPNPTVHPPTRSSHTACWDPLTRRLIVFGGDGWQYGLLGDLWILDLDLDNGAVSGLPDPAPARPGTNAPGFGFRAVWPNPTVGPAALRFALPRAASVSVDVFDVSGRHVRQLLNGELAEGVHDIQWNGDGYAGPVPSGIYYVVIRSGGGRDARRLVVTR